MSAQTVRAGAAEPSSGRDQVSLSTDARDARPTRPPESESRPKSCTCDHSDEAEQDAAAVKLRLFELVVRALAGHGLREAKLKLDGPAARESARPARSPAAIEPGTRGRTSLQADWVRVRSEREHTHVSARGQVMTEDGRHIELSLQVDMQRQETQIEQVSLQQPATKTKDPLVLQLGGAGPRLGEESFTFDIDADGTLDRLRTLGPESAFVALDRDQNGAIDDGSELFGARTGDGFAELAAFDSDDNGWIDEADPVFDQLRLWVPDSSGPSTLSSLAQRGVGAIYLGNVGSRFELKDATQELGGVVQATGLWLSEDGQAHAAQQVDLVAQPAGPEDE